MEYLISVVVPIYNVELYLNKCVESIMQQSYENIEIILVDDGSLDKSGDICDGYAKKDNRIKVIHKENGGLSSARNAGIHMSTGNYICFIDSDDWINKEFIEKLFSKIIEYDADIVVCGFTYEYGEKSIENNFIGSQESLDRHEALENLFNGNYLNMTVAWNKLYKKKLFDTIQYEVGIINEDENIIHEILYKSSKVICIDKCLYHYRMRENSITQKTFSIKNLDSVHVYENRLAFFEENNENEFVALTLHKYFRVLLNNICNVYYSDIDNKSVYYDSLKSKLDSNLNRFINLNDMKLSTRCLLLCYRINAKLGIYSNKLLQRLNRK
ncbi:glycosyltransferase family 2 protein [Paenibacillus sp. NPDC057934]|uniref:glycosyltransferase family 2 protein n=1 Tax=Paenibacillus sp. NPDC057934 TaxID=3346282 RepID=UPI0036D7E64F